MADPAHYSSTVNQVGHYCGRFSQGFFGEPQNSSSNLVFVIGALYALYVWRKRGSQDRWQVVLFALAACIGVGSFIFHSMPNRSTLMMDLVPIQIFALAYFFYIGIRHFRGTKLAVSGAVLLFFLVRQGWLQIAPRGFLGGGVSHIPTLALLIPCGVYLHRKGQRLGNYMLWASVTYFLALLPRSWDLPFCAVNPYGLHWVWHLLTGLTASILVYGIIDAVPCSPDLSEQNRLPNHSDSPAGFANRS